MRTGVVGVVEAVLGKHFYFYYNVTVQKAFPGGTSGNAGDVRDMGSIPGWGRSPGGGHGYPLQYSWLERPINREAWQAMVHRVAKSRTRLSILACRYALFKDFSQIYIFS